MPLLTPPFHTGILVACLTLVLFGCSKPGDNGGPLGEVDPPNEADQGTVVGIVSPALTSIFHVGYVKGAVEEGKALGWKVESLAGDRETNFAAQIDLVESLITRKVHAISICAINDKAIVAAVEKANEAEIPIFIYASLTDLPGGQVTSYLGFNQQKAGTLCAEYAVEKLRQKYSTPRGKIFILEGIPGFHSKERTTGFHAVLDAFPEIQIVGQSPANWERQQGMNLASAALQVTPDLDLFLACSDAMAQGAAQAAIESESKVLTIGIDGNPDTLKDIREGVVTASCAVFPEEIGRMTIRTMAAYLSGATVEHKIETPIKIIDQSNLGEMTGEAL